MPPATRPSRLLVYLATACTMLALLVFLIGIAVSMAAYNHANAVPYSVLNHAISELGFPFASSRTWVFNVSVATSALLLLPMLWAVSRRLHTFIGYLAAIIATLAFVALALMALLGLTHDIFGGSCYFLWFLRKHIYFAIQFFIGWMIAAAFFTVAFVLRRKQEHTRPMLCLSILCCFPFATAFVVAPLYHPVETSMQKDFDSSDWVRQVSRPMTSATLSPWIDHYRPRFWPQVFLEWCIAWTALLWFAIAIVFIRSRPTICLSSPLRP